MPRKPLIVEVLRGYVISFVEDGSSSASNGGEAIVLDAAWQYLTPDNNTFGLAIGTEIVSSVDTTETSSKGQL